MAKFQEVVRVTFWSAVSFGFLCLAIHLVELWHKTTALGWDRVPGTIERFSVTYHPEDSESLKVDLEYRYKAGGKEWVGTRWMPKGNRSATYEEISDHLHELTGELPTTTLQLEGRTVFCRVDENDFSHSVLIPDRQGFISACSLAGVALIFVGTCLLLGRKGTRPGPLPVAFALVFVLGGLVATSFFIWKFSAYLAMRKWVESPATIAERHAEQGRGISSSRPRLHYTYQHLGSEYRASRFDVVESFQRGRRGQPTAEKTHPQNSRVFAVYHPGKQCTVFVDPAKPWRAVIDRSGRGLLIVGILALAHSIFAAFLLRWTLRGGGLAKAKLRKGKCS
jgi:hypothetical protein